MTSTSLLIFALRFPFTTLPISHVVYPYFSRDSFIKSFAFSAAIIVKIPPDVSAENPSLTLKSCIPVIFKFIFSIIGKDSITRSTSANCAAAKFYAWPRIPKPVTSVAPWESYFFNSKLEDLLRVAIDSIAKWYAWVIFSAEISGGLKSLFPESFCCKLTAG